jgi:hypothetical protein
MLFRKFALATASVLAFACADQAMAADDTVTAKNAAGSTITFCSKDTGSGVMASCSQLVSSAGAKIDPMTKTGGTVGLVAGEAHLGEVGGNQLTVTVAQTVSTSPAYTTGDAVGGLMTVANAERVAGKGGLLLNVVANMKSAQTAQIDVFFFTANPTGSTCTDNAAFVLATADFSKLKGVVHLNDWTAGNVASFGQAQAQPATPYTLPSGTTAYACAVVRGAPTYTATTDVSFDFNFSRN